MALPALLLAATLRALTAHEPGALSEEAAAVDAQLAAENPEVLLVGNSLVGYGVNTEDFAAALGRAGYPRRVSKLFSASLRPANWYVMLKNRVYAAGYQPELVVVVGTPRMFFDVEPPTSVGKDMLAAHMSDYEPVINAKVYGRASAGSLLRHRLQAGRASVQELVRATVRDASVGLLFGGEGGLLQRGHTLAEPAMQAVFGAEDAVDMSLHHRVIPVLQQAVDEDGSSPGRQRLARYEETLLPDIIELVQGGGGRLVFVWIPLAPTRGDMGEIDDDRMAELIQALNEAGVGWLDLHERALPPGSFFDSLHMSRKGRTDFTPALAAALEGLGALGGDALSPARVPLVLEPALTWSGPAPSEAEPWRLAAGASVALSFSGWPEDIAGRGLQVWLEPLDDSAAPALSVDGAAVPLTPEGRWLVGRWTDGGAGPPSVRIASAGGDTALRWMSATAGERRADVVGSEEAVQPVRVDLTLPFARKQATFTDPPFEVPLSILGAHPADDRVARSNMDGLLALGDAQISARTPCRACSPLTVLEDGVPLPEHRPRCGRKKLEGAGWFCMPEGRALLVGTDGALPVENGRRYTWALDPGAHYNEGGLWLYPGGAASIPLRKEHVSRLSGGPLVLALEGMAFGGPAGGAEVSVRVRVGDALRAEREVAISALEAGVVEIPVAPGFTGRERPVIELETAAGAPFVLLTRVEIGEPQPAGVETL